MTKPMTPLPTSASSVVALAAVRSSYCPVTTSAARRMRLANDAISAATTSAGTRTLTEVRATLEKAQLTAAATAAASPNYAPRAIGGASAGCLGGGRREVRISAPPITSTMARAKNAPV